MKRILPIVLTLFASTVWGQTSTSAQPTVTRSPPKNVLTYTTAEVVLYVDPTGSDTQACTSTGVGACLTLQGAFNKIPKGLRHRATVTAAAGNYAGVTISGFTIDTGFQKTTAGILLDGALANVTPTTGSATGTATSGTAGSGSTFGTLTDTGATWTINDAALVGKFVTITGGTGSGQVRVIASNTATVLTIAGTWTAPTGTSTYALQSPSVVITSPSLSIPGPIGGTTNTVGGAIMIVGNTTTNSPSFQGMIEVRNVATASTLSGVSMTEGGSVSLIQVLLTSTIGSSVIAQGADSLSILSSSLLATSGIPLSLSGSGETNMQQTRIYSATGAGIFVTSGAKMTASLGVDVTGVRCLTVVNGASARLGSSKCDCLSLADSAGISVGTFPSIVVGTASTYFNSARFGSLNVTNCTYGVLVAGPGASATAESTHVLSGNALTYAVNAVHGGSIILPTAIATITGGTAEMSVDTGSATGAFSTLAASFNCLMAVGTTSRICRL